MSVTVTLIEVKGTIKQTVIYSLITLRQVSLMNLTLEMASHQLPWKPK